MPLIISSGVNSGSQASTLVIRAMAVGELRIRDWWQVVRREIVVGACLGIILGLIGFLRISVWSALPAGPPAPRVRSGDIVGALRRHGGGCNGTRDLFSVGLVVLKGTLL